MGAGPSESALRRGRGAARARGRREDHLRCLRPPRLLRLLRPQQQRRLLEAEGELLHRAQGRRGACDADPLSPCASSWSNGSPRLHGKVASVGTTQLRPIVISANSEHTTPRSASQRVAWCRRADAVWDFKRVCCLQRPRGESKRSAIESQLHPPYVLVLGSRATQADSTVRVTKMGYCFKVYLDVDSIRPALVTERLSYLDYSSLSDCTIYCTVRIRYFC